MGIVSMMLKQKRPMTISVYAVWLLVGSIPMLVHGALRVADTDISNTQSPFYDNELNQKLGLLLWISLPLGGLIAYLSPLLVLVLTAYNYATAILAMRGFRRAYEMIFVVLGIGFISGFFAFGYFFIGLYAIFINIVWIFYLRRDDVKMYYHRKI